MGSIETYRIVNEKETRTISREKKDRKYRQIKYKTLLQWIWKIIGNGKLPKKL